MFIKLFAKKSEIREKHKKASTRGSHLWSMLCDDNFVQHIIDTVDTCIWYVLPTELSHKENIWWWGSIISGLKESLGRRVMHRFVLPNIISLNLSFYIMKMKSNLGRCYQNQVLQITYTLRLDFASTFSRFRCGEIIYSKVKIIDKYWVYV